MRVPVLTYHATNISGNDYDNNDHIAFAADLRLVDDLGLRIVPLHWVVDCLLGRSRRDLTNCVALSCDDGSDFDYFDLVHPKHGLQRSLFNTLRDLRRECTRDRQPHLHLTAFVIVSAKARKGVEETCLLGRNWMRDTWWYAAAASGLMAIESHSLDHNHPCLEDPGPDGMARGNFQEVNNAARAEAEIAHAQQILRERIAPYRSRLFCYPFGHVPDYLRTEWLPRNAARLGLDAAFSDGARPVGYDCDIWNLPRYICGQHWKSPAELKKLLCSR